jgi:4-hydroxy-tetrahydrodipicolinate synthase
MVTPFDAQGQIAFDVATELAQFLQNSGTDALVVAGSTGEGTSLSDEEKLNLFAAVAAAVTIPVIAGSTSSDTARSVSLTRAVSGTGVAGVLATTPAYARPSQAGIAAHLSAVAESTDLPVMLYDIPSRTGRKIAAETSIALARGHHNVVALKDASGDLVGAAHVVQTVGSQLALYSGDDGLTLAFMAMGAVGVVSVASHWAGREFSAMVNAAAENRWDEARRLNEVVAPSCRFESSDSYPNPLPAKSAMRQLGIPVGQCRLPLGSSDATLDALANETLAQLTAARG